VEKLLEGVESILLGKFLVGELIVVVPPGRIGQNRKGMADRIELLLSFSLLSFFRSGYHSEASFL
jgi:hypothetical protein